WQATFRSGSSFSVMARPLRMSGWSSTRRRFVMAVLGSRVERESGIGCVIEAAKGTGDDGPFPSDALDIERGTDDACPVMHDTHPHAMKVTERLGRAVERDVGEAFVVVFDAEADVRGHGVQADDDLRRPAMPY